jgi:anthranilate phosphoribosyltransferase
VSLVEAIRRAVERQHVDAVTMDAAMEAILAGEGTEAQIAALAVALRMKGETAQEIAAAVRVMRRRGIPVPIAPGAALLDTCGTGGDGLGTFNISTVAAIVVAACGVRVAKHGNRGVSSPTGSADFLEALGVAIDLGPEEVAECIEVAGIGFMFAPRYHAALKHAGPVRRSLGIRTFFNLLGPLSNPAPVTHQLIGVYDPSRVKQLAEVLGLLGLEAAWVVHGEGGFDEVSPVGPTRVAMLAGGRVTERTLAPTDFGLEPATLESIVGGDAATNAAIARRILAGEPGGPRTAVLLNAGAALCVAGRASTPREGAELAAAAIDEGRASAVLTRWVEQGARAPRPARIEAGER